MCSPASTCTIRRQACINTHRLGTQDIKCRALSTTASTVQLALNEPKSARAREKSNQYVKFVGLADRGVGLVYRDMQHKDAETDVSRLPKERFVVKVQAPLDVSSDSAGGIGMMTPTTLLVTNANCSLIRYVPENEGGHETLLRACLRSPFAGQTGYFWAEHVTGFFREDKLQIDAGKFADENEIW